MSKIEKIGVIVSDKMEKSVVVEVAYRYRHPMYSKIVVKTKRYMAHDEDNQCDRGRIRESADPHLQHGHRRSQPGDVDDRRHATRSRRQLPGQRL